DLRGLPVEAFLLIADVADGLAGERAELGRVDDLVAVLVQLHQRIRKADLASDDDAVRRCKRLAGDAHAPGIDPGPFCFAIDKVYDLVRNSVADLIWMAF